MSDTPPADAARLPRIAEGHSINRIDELMPWETKTATKAERK
jgi:hypothetical protein